MLEGGYENEETHIGASARAPIELEREAVQDEEARLAKNRVSAAIFRKRKEAAPVEYSAGESGSEFLVKLKDLKDGTKNKRIMYLWKRIIKRSRGAGQLLHKMY